MNQFVDQLLVGPPAADAMPDFHDNFIDLVTTCPLIGPPCPNGKLCINAPIMPIRLLTREPARGGTNTTGADALGQAPTGGDSACRSARACHFTRAWASISA